MELFATKLRVLVIHHDTILLNQIQQICDRCNYLVTLCTSPSYALHLLMERNGYFDMMLIDVCMPNMDSYDFVRYVTLHHNIPVIVISSDLTNDSVIKSIIYGACDYWVQPLHENQFKIMWQHVARKTYKAKHQVFGFSKVQSPKEPDVVGFLEAQSPKEAEVVGLLEAQHKRKRESEDTSAQKSRLSWTPQLHEQFVNAVNQLGLNEAKPRRIMKIMDVSGLTTAQVASHLQKYRDYLKRASCREESKKSPTECIDKTSLECQQAESMLPQQEHSSQLNSNLQSDTNSNDVCNNQVCESMRNDKTSLECQQAESMFQQEEQTFQLNSILQSENEFSDIIKNDFDWFLNDLDEELISGWEI